MSGARRPVRTAVRSVRMIGRQYQWWESAAGPGSQGATDYSRSTGNAAPVNLQEGLPGHPTGWGWLDSFFREDSLDGVSTNLVAEVAQVAADPGVAPARILLRHPNDELLDAPRGPRATRFRYQRSKVSGVTIGPIPAKVLRLSFLAFVARRRRWASVKGRRRSPTCSRRIRFSSRRYAMTSCWR